jgi:hypothetical protein
MDDVTAPVADAAGLLDFKTYWDAEGRYLAGCSRWENEDAVRQALPAIRASAPRRDPAWTCRPDEAIRLVSVSPTNERADAKTK